jgi:hypothetical protein
MNPEVLDSPGQFANSIIHCGATTFVVKDRYAPHQCNRGADELGMLTLPANSLPEVSAGRNPCNGSAGVHGAQGTQCTTGAILGRDTSSGVSREFQRLYPHAAPNAGAAPDGLQRPLGAP